MEQLFYATVELGVGTLQPLTLVWSDQGLCRILFSDQEDFETDGYLKKYFPLNCFYFSEAVLLSGIRLAK